MGRAAWYAAIPLHLLKSVVTRKYHVQQYHVFTCRSYKNCPKSECYDSSVIRMQLQWRSHDQAMRS